MDGGAPAPGERGSVLTVYGTSERTLARHTGVVRLAGRRIVLLHGPRRAQSQESWPEPNCVLTTGCNALDEGLDLVAEGAAAKVGDEAKLRRVADAYLSKYGSDWHFAVRDGAFFHAEAGQGGEAWVYEVVPKKVFGFGKDQLFSQTRWRF